MRLLTKIGESPKLLRFVPALLVVFLASSVFAQVDVSATVDRNALNPEDTLTLSISVNSSEEVTIGQPSLPSSLSEFEVLNEWTSQEARASFVTTSKGPQFKTVRTTSYNYMLQPKRQGSLSIGAVEVVVDGKTYYTKPMTIRVAPGAGAQARPQAGRGAGGGMQLPPGFEDDENDLFSQLLRRGGPPPPVGSKTLNINTNEAFFVHAEVDKTEVYVGEQVTASWYLYTRGQIRDLDTLKYPSLKGFWKEDIEIATHLNFEQEIVNGIPYKKALLASFALFPIKEGSATIDSYQAKCTVIPGMDMFGNGGFGKAFTFTKASLPMKINVKPIPAEGRPADFSGAVGDFQVTSRVEDNNPVANQPFTFKIRFEGKGNAKLIDIPPFQPPEGMELYDNQKEAKFFRTGTSYKDFNILLIPRREGEFIIPGISVSIFDPETKKYVSKTTEPVRVVVNQGQAVQGAQSLAMDAGSKVSKPADAPPSIITEYQRSRLFTPAQQGVGATGLFGLVTLLLLWRARTEMGWGQRKKDLSRRLKARLRRVESKVSQGDWRGVGTEMTNTVYFVLGEISGEGGANVELEKLMLKAPPSVRRELSGPLAKQMDYFQVLSFAPEGMVGDLKNPDQMKKAIAEMVQLMEKAVSLGLSSAQDDEF